MKKFLLFLVALVATVSMSAQTVESSKFFDNTYVGLNTGVSAWLHPHTNGLHQFDDFGNSIRSISSLRFGKFVTPILGFEIEGEVGLANTYRLVDHTTVGLNTLINLNNAIHGYKGCADVFEIVPFVGLGWYHTYGVITNNIVGKGGIQMNWNLGASQAWQINLIPSINWILTDDDWRNGDKFDSRRAFLALQVGMTYKFKNSHGTHNFVLCPFRFTQADIDMLNAEVNEERMKVVALACAVSEQDNVIKCLQKQIDEMNSNAAKTVNVNGVNVTPVIGFDINDATILPTQKANLEMLANALKENDKVTLVVNGYADADTGTAEYNKELSLLRAQNVKTALVNLGVKADNISVVANGSTTQIFKENNLNRAVVFVVK